MRHRLELGSTVYFHDHLMTARIEGREGGREGREFYFVYFSMLISLSF